MHHLSPAIYTHHQLLEHLDFIGPNHYGSKARGSVPLGWSYSPAMAVLMPTVLRYGLYKQQVYTRDMHNTSYIILNYQLVILSAIIFKNVSKRNHEI